MRRWLSLIGTLMLVLMVWTGTTAHAAEAMGCIEVSAESTGHFDGDRDEVPADSDKAVPHHHGGCHGHHVAVADRGEPDANATASVGYRTARVKLSLARADSGTALSPPIA